MTAEDEEAERGGEWPGSAAAEAGGVVGIGGDGLKLCAYKTLGCWADLSTTCGGGDDSNSSGPDVLRLLERARADLDVAIQRYDGEMRLRAGQPSLGSRCSAEANLPTSVEGQVSKEPSSEEGPPPPRVTGAASAPPSPIGMDHAVDLRKWLRLPSASRNAHSPESDLDIDLDGVLPGSPDRRQISKASKPKSEPCRVLSHKLDGSSSLGRSPDVSSTRAKIAAGNVETDESRMKSMDSLHVGVGIPCTVPSISPKGWVRRLSREDVGFESPLASFMAPKETRTKRKRKATRLQQSLKKMQTRLWYETLRMVLIIFDACVVVWEAERAGRLAAVLPAGGQIPDEPALLLLSDFLFVLFLVDALLRYAAEPFGLSDASGNGWRWFNLITVSTHFLQIVAHHVHVDQRSSSGLRIATSAFSTLRILRVVSLVQVTSSIRNMALLRELRILVHSLIGALQSLLWCSCMSFLVLLAFGMLFSEGALAFRMQAVTTDATTLALMQDFGTVLTSSLSLYKSMSGGADWGDIYVSLDPLGGAFSFLFLIFITFATIALLNVATAVFVESTMRRSHSDREMMVLSELNDKREFMESVRRLFEEFETDNDSGGITKSELQKHLEDPKIGAYFAKLGVDVDHFEKLYNLLDRDNSGFIDLEEFTFGCVRLRGEAKCLDIEDLRRSIKSACETFRTGLDGLDMFTQNVTDWFEAQRRDLSATVDGRLGQLDAALGYVSKDLASMSQGLGAIQQHQPALGETLRHLEASVQSLAKEATMQGSVKEADSAEQVPATPARPRALDGQAAERLVSPEASDDDADVGGQDARSPEAPQPLSDSPSTPVTAFNLAGTGLRHAHSTEVLD